MPSVMQKIVRDAGVRRPRGSRPGRRRPGTKMHGGVGAGLGDRLGDRVEDGDPVVERVLAALAGRHAGHDVGAVVQHLAGVELALAAGDALDDEPRVAVDEDAHAAPPAARRPRGRAARRPWRPPRRGWRRSRSGPPRGGAAASSAFVPDDADDHGHLALLAAPRLDQAAGDLVAAGDAAEDVDQDRLAPCGSARMRRIAAATLSALAPPPMSRKLAGSPPARLTRSIVVIASPAPLTMQPIGAVEVDEADVVVARLDVGRVLLVEVAQLLQVRVAGERGVVEGDLGVEAGEALDAGPRRPLSRTIASGLTSTRSASFAFIVATRPLAIFTKSRRCGPPSPTREGQLARLVVEQAEERMGRDPEDRLRRRPGDLLDLDAALGRAP